MISTIIQIVFVLALVLSAFSIVFCIGSMSWFRATKFGAWCGEIVERKKSHFETNRKDRGMKIFACSSVWQFNDGRLKQSLNMCNARTKEEAIGIHIETCAYRDKWTMGGILCAEWKPEEKYIFKHD